MTSRQDIANKALSYRGYLSGQGYDQANQFSSLLGRPAESWCADFVSAIFALCGVPLPLMQSFMPGRQTGFSYVPTGWAYARAHNVAYSSWYAQPGDIAIFDWTGAQTATTSKTHTEVVIGYSGSTLTTVGGNSGPSGGVNEHTWSAPRNQGNSEMAGVINTSGLVRFGTQTPVPIPVPHPPTVVPAWPGRYLTLKTPDMQGADVKEFQQQLYNRGWHTVPDLSKLGWKQVWLLYSPGAGFAADGIYGPNTQAVVLAFQKQKGLNPDGIVGPATWNAAWTSPVTSN